MKPDKLYFTSDHHFGHANILGHAHRDFTTINEMNKYMIDKWNEKIPVGADVYHLGDFSFTSPDVTCSIIDSLNGSIYLIQGNHDRYNAKVKAKFQWIKDMYYLKVNDPDARGGKQKIVLCHYPLRSWRAMGHSSYHLFGHCHGNMRLQIGKSFDVGVDCHDFTPLSYNEVKSIMDTKKLEMVDYHK